DVMGDVALARSIAGLVEGEDVAVIEPARQSRFVLEAPQHLVGLQTVDVEPHGLERDRASDGGIDRFVDAAHGPTAEFTADLVAPDFFRRFDFHRGLPATHARASHSHTYAPEWGDSLKNIPIRAASQFSGVPMKI